MKDILLNLHDIGAIKFGEFTLKSGIVSPIYIDLRDSISYPSLLKAIAEEVWNKVSHCHFDRLCGVPYTALPLASYLSIAHSIPMILRRKEQKDYGTKKNIEGAYEKNHVSIILEDLITSGSSVLETIAPIEEAGMKVHDVAVFLDREQGGRKRLESKGYRVHSVTTISEMLNILHVNRRIDNQRKEMVMKFIKENTHG